MFYLELVQNVGLLVSLVVIHGQIIRRWNRYTLASQIFSGFLFGCVALIGMMTPVHLMTGVIFDGRSIVLSVAGLFGGPVTAGMAAVISAAYRLWLGGSGVIMGTSAIVGSAGLGVAFYYLRPLYPGLTRNLYLFGFGLLVHVGMLSLTLTLPREAMLETLEHIAMPVLLIYPAATWLICLLFLDQENRVSSEENVRENAKNLSALFNAVNEAVFLIRSDGEILAANETLASRLGKSSEDIVGHCVFDYLEPSVAARRRTWVDEVVRSGKPMMIEDERQNSIVVHSLYPIFNPAGVVDRLAGFAKDVTEVRRSESAMRDSEARFRLFVEAANEGVWSMDGDYRTVFVNPKMAEMLGYTPEEMLGRTVQSFMFAEDLPDHKTRMSKRIRGEKESYERRFRRKDGEQIWTLVSATALKDSQGNFAGSFAMFTDITERKHAADLLGASEELYRNLFDQAKEQEELYKALLNCSPDPIVVYDTEGRVQYLNPAHSKLFGWTLEEAQGKRLNTLPDWDLEATLSIISQILTEGAMNQSYDTQRLSKQGQLIDVSVSGERFLDHNGNPAGMLVVLHDITDRKLAEREREALRTQLLQAQKMEAVGTLAGGVAHDFNNLLQAISGYSELLMMNKKQGDPELDDLQRIYESTKRGADLVKSLMMFSRRTKPELRPVDLNHEIVEVQKILFKTIPKIIEMVLRLSGKLETVLADPSQIGQILMNLGVNARDAMPDGGTLTIETANVQLDYDNSGIPPEVKPGPYVLLTVSDSGCGMDKQTVEHIFDPFFTTKEVGKGTGLGLATVYGIVKEHEGLITCDSEPGHGTTFKIYLPAIQTEKTSELPKDDIPIQGGTETILLVEDEESLRLMSSRHLNQYGYHVITASNGREALDIYPKEGKSISLIILDLVMPVMDGRKCLEKILGINPNAKVIIASGVIEEGSTNVAQVKGAKGSIRKPFDIKGLLRMVREVLDKD